MADPELVMPAWVAKLVPDWLNHGVLSLFVSFCIPSPPPFLVSHTAPVAFVLVDTLLTCHHAPDRKIGSTVVVALFLFYVGMSAEFESNGIWHFPIILS